MAFLKNRPRILYGTNPIAWSNDDDRQLGADIPLQQCLQEAAHIGFDGIEKGHKMPDDADQLKAVLAPYQLRFISAWHSLSLLQQDMDIEKQKIDAHLDLLQAMDCKVCIVCETTGAIHVNDAIPLTRKPILGEDQWIPFTRAVEAIARHAAERDIILVYHHHMGTVIQTAAEIHRFMALTGPDTKLLLDTGHAFFAGADPQLLASRYAHRIQHVHCKNVREPVMKNAIKHNWSFLESVRNGVFTVPGDPEGAVDFQTVLAVLADSGYAGWLVSEAEQNPDRYNPLSYQSMGFSALRQLAKKTKLDTSEQVSRP